MISSRPSFGVTAACCALYAIGAGSVIASAPTFHAGETELSLFDDSTAYALRERVISEHEAQIHEHQAQAAEPAVGNAHPLLCDEKPCPKAPDFARANAWYGGQNKPASNPRGLSGRSRRRGIVKSRHKHRK